jgi:hypothetical protein
MHFVGRNRTKITQPNDRRLMKTAAREINVARLDPFVPVGLNVVQLIADPANQEGLIGTG